MCNVYITKKKFKDLLKSDIKTDNTGYKGLIEIQIKDIQTMYIIFLLLTN